MFGCHEKYKRKKKEKTFIIKISIKFIYFEII